MTLADTFTAWKSGVLVGLGAPDNAITTDALWAWQSAEGGIGHNNPLNTTYPMAGGVPWNTLPSGLHVWSYVDIADGINATVVTLLAPDPAVGLPNGYDIIVDHLRRSVPRAQWGDACWQLDKWGTGCGWLTTVYGAAPGNLTPPIWEDDMALILDNPSGILYSVGSAGRRHVELNEWTALQKLGIGAAENVPNGYVRMDDMSKIPIVPEVPAPANPTQLAIDTKAELDRIEAALKGA